MGWVAHVLNVFFLLRSAFSTNLLEMISLEHANTVAASSRPPGRRDKADWKFAQVGTMASSLIRAANEASHRQSFLKPWLKAPTGAFTF